MDSINNKYFHDQLNFVHNHYFLVLSITQLKSQNFPLEKQIEIIDEVRNKLSSIYSEKFKKILNKNPDYFQMIKDIKDDYLPINKYLPLTTYSVERSFSYLKLLLEPNRTSLSEENMEKYLFIFFNNSK